jgi:cytochrome c oxidase cbb3-type subunit 3
MAKLLDHEYDGIQEYDNPIPTWLGALFVITIVWGIGYALYYPSFPHFQGISGWSSDKQYNEQVEVEETRYAPIRKEAEKKALEALASLSSDQATVAAGQKVFSFHCAPCHGDNAEGKVGPSLADDVWVYGSEPKDILTSIRDGRPKGMPKWKTKLNQEEVKDVTVYVMSLVKTGASSDTSTDTGNSSQEEE